MSTLRLVAIYGTNTALTRAVTLLSVLYLSRHYSLGDIGVYGLSHTFAQLVVPIITLGATAAIVREGVVNASTGAQLVRLVVMCAVSAGALGSGARYFHLPIPLWIQLGALIGMADAVHTAVIAYCQSRERPWAALALSLSRVIALLGCIVLSLRLDASIATLLESYVAVSFALGAVAVVGVRLAVSDSGLVSAPVRRALRYSVITVPHSIALWMVNGSDRMWIAALVGEEAVGAYTLAYTVGQVSLVLNSGVAAAMATRVANDYDQWRADGVLSRFLATIGNLTVAILLASLTAVFVDQEVLGLVRWPQAPVYLWASIITSAFYISNFYISYAAFLFYHRNTLFVTVGTLVTAPITVGAMYLLISRFGTIGAAVGTMIGYALMALAYLIGLNWRTGEFRTEWFQHLRIAVGYSAAMIAAGVAFEYVAR